MIQGLFFHFVIDLSKAKRYTGNGGHRLFSPKYPICSLKKEGSFLPLLDFQCKKCGTKFEELVFSFNKDKVRCPSCESTDLKQVYEGKCLFGPLGSSSSSGGCSGKSCSGCSGCH